LLALVEDAGSRWSDLTDLLKGALVMRIGSVRTKPLSQIVLASLLAGAIIGGIVAKTMRTRYVSTAVVVIDDMEPRTASKRLSEVYMQGTTRRELSTLIQEQNLYPKQRERAPLEDVVEQFRRDIRMSVATRLGDTDNSAAVVSFVYDDGRTAQRVTNALVAKFIEVNATLPSPGTTMKVLEAASLPVIPQSPVVWRVVGAGALAGLLAGLIAATWAKRTRAPRHHSA
jgi:capsular polysaccharide biosynthesis protein